MPLPVTYTNWKRQSAAWWVETLRPKWTFWRFPDFKRGKDNVSSPIPSMQCCATVRATFRKQETSQLWMEGTGEGCGFLCFWSYPIWVQCLNNFFADCRFKYSGFLKQEIVWRAVCRLSRSTKYKYVQNTFIIYNDYCLKIFQSTLVDLNDIEVSQTGLKCAETRNQLN